MILKKRHHKKVQPILILVIFITMGILIAVFWSARQSQGPPATAASTPDEEATLSIEGIQMTTTRDGKTAWNLTARTGHYIDQHQKANFDEIATIFYTDEGQRVDLTADKGSYNSGSNDLEVSGNVVVKNSQYEMKTRHLIYDHRQRSLKSNQPVSVWSDATSMTAAAMIYNLQTGKITFYGKISGIISDNIVL
ncbi:MAG: LPS export ABC transporter periplasmic protein LptC [Desulfobacterales bacterium]|jgi:LPS export ABC transporter protein LptC|nr:LPS export ABC transporter periplasmic protein LptC [Desulfobacterales bacterium]